MDFFVLRSKEESREDCKLMCHSECPHKWHQLGSLVCTFFCNLISRLLGLFKNVVGCVLHHPNVVHCWTTTPVPQYFREFKQHRSLEAWHAVQGTRNQVDYYAQCCERRSPRRQWQEARRGDPSSPFSFVARRSSKGDAMTTKADRQEARKARKASPFISSSSDLFPSSSSSSSDFRVTSTFVLTFVLFFLIQVLDF
ncbi:hypothetical protein H5410_054417 [Solanum commersonii]|uniref:Uncharacterized protein n=1 Tax=Solanum commersonii TaxID=4109 RepID=A0A9J5WEV5_SOLCO|nr:hypothetical protein H5410_054417 [Solanum commersonii]